VRPLLLAAFLVFLRAGLRAGFFLRAAFLRVDAAFLRGGLRADFFFRREALRFDFFFATVTPPSG